MLESRIASLHSAFPQECGILRTGVLGLRSAALEAKTFLSPTNSLSHLLPLLKSSLPPSSREQGSRSSSLGRIEDPFRALCEISVFKCFSFTAKPEK
jgi:hypothetical protein